LTLTVADEQTDSPTITRMEIWRGGPGGKRLPLRKTVPAGVGVVLDRKLEMSLADGTYAFRMVRGPEYRVVSGTFSLEDTSLDEHAVRLPRMVNMLDKGWTSGDCCVQPSPHSLPLRMASEDLHLACTLGHVDARPIAGRDRDEPIENDPAWIRTDAQHQGGLIFYGLDSSSAATPSKPQSGLPSERLAQVLREHPQTRVAIENPFAWPLPIWLASGQIDGVFILGDWLRLDKKVLTVPDGRAPPGASFGGGKDVGRWAERIYWNLLEAGFRIPPLAGSGSEGRTTPVGYNRLYVAEQLESYQQGQGAEVRRLLTPEAWWDAAWQGHSVATNGPLLFLEVQPAARDVLRPGQEKALPVDGRSDVRVALDVVSAVPLDRVEILRNGAPARSFDARGRGRVFRVEATLEIAGSAWIGATALG
ncbi:MAG: hypothetical protein MI861_16120, partial [Pirellulales bacterium]|nr:hypothetical protein [Pirellulales bacterium]